MIDNGSPFVEYPDCPDKFFFYVKDINGRYPGIFMMAQNKKTDREVVFISITNHSNYLMKSWNNPTEAIQDLMSARFPEGDIYYGTMPELIKTFPHYWSE